MQKQVLAVLLTVLAAGCSDSGPSVGKVNGDAISVAQFDAFLKFKRIPAEDEKKRGAQLDQYLEREALRRVIEQETSFDKTALEAEVNEFRKEAAISRYFNDFLNRTVDDEAVRSYYVSNAKQFEERKVHVAHILVRTTRNMNETERKAKLTTMQEAHGKIVAGTDFAKVAADYSEDTISGKKGGDLGWMKEGSIDPRFSETIFTLEEGKVSEPFETPFGFHVVKVLEAPQVVKRPLEAVQGEIRYQLRNLAKDAELKRLLGKVKIEKQG